MGNFNYKDYCIGLTIGIKFPQKFSIEDKLGELTDYFIEKCSFKDRKAIKTTEGPILQVKKDLMEIVIDCENFTGSYLYFFGDQMKESLFPKPDNISKMKLDGKLFIYNKSYEQIQKDFINVFNVLFRYFKNITNIDKVDRVGMVHYFMVFYDDIKLRYPESLQAGADLPFENHNKLARNQYRYDKTDYSWKNAIIEYKIDKDQKLYKPFGKFTLDIQTYYEPNPILLDKIGGEEKIVQELFTQTYDFIDKSKIFEQKK